ncbi:tyrosinase family oxidase copper chaperone [Streptomyces sp. NPDC048436]|uniref:tyrosinase family oxidase copper chaperone n=1 Tax=Streptomyces sp. NPDC048436 TaxID=3365550 RepID=UPI00372210F2
MVEAAAADGPGAAKTTRRTAARGLIGFAVAAVTAPAALLWTARTRQADHPPSDDLGEGSLDDSLGDGSFDEVYAGRHIRGARAAGVRQHTGAAWDITVDGRPLHLMRRADGGYLSMIDHYQSFPTPLLATRRAVDELGPTQQLRAGPA